MIVEMDSKNIKIQKACPFCGTLSEVVIPTEGYGKWVRGEVIQKAMPTVPATSREFLMTGMCRDCQDKIFGGDEEEEE
jgi:hypothetical protein